jgi:hypothetical protein
LARLFKSEEHGGHGYLHMVWGGDAAGVLPINRYHLLSLINPDGSTKSLVLNLMLQPAARLHGTVVGPDGKPLPGVRVTGLLAIPDGDMVLENASFALMGLNPRGTRKLVFFDNGKNLGKAVTIRGNETEPLKVQLEPYGWVLGQTVDTKGNPLPGTKLRFAPLGGPWCRGVTVETDRDGRFREALLPGQKYATCLPPGLRLLRRQDLLEVESGQIKDLGTLTFDH